MGASELVMGVNSGSGSRESRFELEHSSSSIESTAVKSCNFADSSVNFRVLQIKSENEMKRISEYNLQNSLLRHV